MGWLRRVGGETYRVEELDGLIFVDGKMSPLSRRSGGLQTCSPGSGIFTMVTYMGDRTGSSNSPHDGGRFMQESTTPRR
jgi:hypothetical protein